MMAPLRFCFPPSLGIAVVRQNAKGRSTAKLDLGLLNSVRTATFG